MRGDSWAAADGTARVLEDVTLEPGGFHQYSGLLGVLGVPAQGYVKAEGLRLSLLKLGVWVRSSTRRVVLSLPREAQYVSEWLQIARSLGAVPT